MLLILDDYSELVAQASRKIEKNRVVTAFDLIKCLKQIKSQRLLLRCAPIYVLPSNKSTMFYAKITICTGDLVQVTEYTQFIEMDKTSWT